MRILFFSHYFPPEGNAPAIRTFQNCSRWVCAGHEVTVITCAPNVPSGIVYEGYKNRLISRENVEGIEVLRVWTLLAPNAGVARRSLSFLSYLFSAVIAAFLVKKPDVVLATSPQFFCGWAGVLAAKLRRRPFILEVRDLWPEAVVAVGAISEGPLIRLLEVLEGWMYRAADHIVTVGSGYRLGLLSRGVPEERISIVMTGVDFEFLTAPPSNAELEAQWNLRGKFVVSYIGTVGMAHGLDLVLATAERLRDRLGVVFLIVGDGARYNDLREQAEGRLLTNVVFAGHQPRSSMPGFLSMSNACLVTLKRAPLFETVLPSKLFEAAAMKRPVILGVEGEAAELVRSTGAGLVFEPESVEELTAAVIRLAEDPSLCRALGAAGHDFVRRRHDANEISRHYLQIVENHA